MSEHPKRWIAVGYRSKRRTLNLALAYRGRSTGWGHAHGNDRPSRWFVGHSRGWSYHRGVDLTHYTDSATRAGRVLFAHEWAASPAKVAPSPHTPEEKQQ